MKTVHQARNSYLATYIERKASFLTVALICITTAILNANLFSRCENVFVGQGSEITKASSRNLVTGRPYITNGEDTVGMLDDLGRRREMVSPLDLWSKPRQASNLEGVSLNKISTDQNLLPTRRNDSFKSNEVREHVYIMGRDFFASHKPLCIGVRSMEITLFNGSLSCNGRELSDIHVTKHCTSKSRAAQKESLFQTNVADNFEDWLKENDKLIKWVDGVSVLQYFDRSCGNIAHYTGRVLFLHHILANKHVYRIGSATLNVLLFPWKTVLPRFISPQLHRFYHHHFLKSILSPSGYSIGPLRDFIQNSRQSTGSLNTQIIDGFSSSSQEIGKEEFICFKHALIPTFLRGRFFISDHLRPVLNNFGKPINSASQLTPTDSLAFRRQVNWLINGESTIPTRTRKIVWIDRLGKYRILDSFSRHVFLGTITKIAKEKNYNFTVVEFSNMTFSQQHSAMKDVSVSIGIHGANLVNTMFMPPQSTLIEIFPFRFGHDMYVGGGNSGLIYKKFTQNNGTEYPGVERYDSPAMCMKLNSRCKVFYRDKVLSLSADDLSKIELILSEALEFYERSDLS